MNYTLLPDPLTHYDQYLFGWTKPGQSLQGDNQIQFLQGTPEQQKSCHYPDQGFYDDYSKTFSSRIRANFFCRQATS